MTQDLSAILARASGYGLEPENQTHVSGAEDAIGVLLDQVEFCILPRTLVVSVNGIRRLWVDAANGGLIEARTVEADVFEPVDLPACISFLKKQFEGCERLDIVSQIPDVPIDASQTGLKAADLMTECRLLRVPPTERLQDLLIAVQDVLFAIYRPDHSVEIVAPDFEASDELLDRIQAEMLDHQGLFNLIHSEEVLVVGLDKTLALAALQTEEGPMALILDRESAADVAAFWAQLPQSLVLSDPG